LNKFKKAMGKLENAMEAASFAEEGDFETAHGVLRDELSRSEQLKKLKYDVDVILDEIDSHNSKAIALSEAGENEKAKELIVEIYASLEKVKKICREISRSLTHAPKSVSDKDKRPSEKERHKKYYYNFYKYKESLSGVDSE